MQDEWIYVSVPEYRDLVQAAFSKLADRWVAAKNKYWHRATRKRYGPWWSKRAEDVRWHAAETSTGLDITYGEYWIRSKLAEREYGSYAGMRSKLLDLRKIDDDLEVKVSLDYYRYLLQIVDERDDG